LLENNLKVIHTLDKVSEAKEGKKSGGEEKTKFLKC
jgi:hypothetical protein